MTLEEAIAQLTNEQIQAIKDGVEFCLSEVELLVRCGGSEVGVMLVRTE